MRQRDPKTGRFLPKAKGPEFSNIEIGQKIERVLQSPLEVFIKKDITGDAKNIGPGSSVILEKLAVIGPTGTNVFRVKRANSERTYYTLEEKVV
jgi:hypothetical protein